KPNADGAGGEESLSPLASSPTWGAVLKVYISIDMEGICGVVREIETDPSKGGEAYQQSRHLMTQEANAAIEGCMKAGATEVLIADSHWNFDNLIPEELNDAATLLRGTQRRKRFQTGRRSRHFDRRPRFVWSSSSVSLTRPIVRS